MGDALPLCGACGAAAFRTSGTCTVCHTHLPSTPVLAPVVGADRSVVCLVLSQQCAHCDTAFVITTLGDNASTTCSACAKDQTVEFAALRQILAYAAAAASHTPDKKQRAQAVAFETGAGRLRATIYRGHPLCDACRKPLAITITKDTTTSACAPCATTTAYHHHKIVMRAGGGAVVGLVAPFSAVGRRDLALDGDPHAVALHCPDCGAGVEVGDRRVVTCSHCGVVAWVPDRAWSAKVAKQPVWLVAKG